MSNTLTLTELLRTIPGGCLSEDEVKSILRQMLDILEPMHAQQPARLHLHIHPDNINIDASGAVSLAEGQASTAYIPGYAPPEQVAGETANIGPWCDFFGLGATLFRLITGQNLPSLDVLAARGGLDLNTFPASVSLPFRQLVQYLTRPVRYHRPRKAADVRRFMDDKGVTLPSGLFPVAALQTTAAPSFTTQQPVEQPAFEAPAPEPEPTPAFTPSTPESEGETLIYGSDNNSSNSFGGNDDFGSSGSFDAFEDNSEPVQEPTPAPRPKKKLSPLVWIIPLIVLLLGGAAALYFIQPKFVSDLLGKKSSSHLSRNHDKDDDDEKDDDDDEDDDDDSTVKVTRSSAGLCVQVEGVKFNMVPIRGGEFVMGRGDYFDEDSHRVKVDDYYIGQTEVTMGLWKAVTGSNYNHSDDSESSPAVNITYYECLSFIEKLNNLLPEDCDLKFRMLTEAEWEYAARGGSSKGTLWAGTSCEENLSNHACFYDNSGSSYDEVASHSPNRFGLYDMSGNVWEWCSDWYANDYYQYSPYDNPQGASSGEKRVIRGGCYASSAGSCRTTYRMFRTPDTDDYDLGLRLAADRN